MDELDEINGPSSEFQFNDAAEVNNGGSKIEEELINNKENFDEGMSDILKKELNPLEDRPIGKSNKFQFSEYPEGFDPSNPEGFSAPIQRKTIERKPLVRKKAPVAAKGKMETEEKPEPNPEVVQTEEKPLEMSNPTMISEAKDPQDVAVKKPKQIIQKKVQYNIEHPTIKPAENIDEKPIGGGGKKFDEFSEEQMFGTSGKGNYDEMAIGGKSKFAISEYPDDFGMPPPDNNQKAEESQAPLGSRIKSKVWKNRQSAFEELYQIFQTKGENDPAFNEYTGEFITFIGDSNPGCQEKALQAVFVWLEKSRSISFDVKEFSKVLIDKCLGAGKPQIKKICLDTTTILFEKSDKSAINEAIIASLNHKNQKTQCAGVAVILELLANFGAKKLDYLKPFYPEVEKLAASTQASARTEAMNFYKEAFKWLGEALRPFLLKLKKAQLDELEKFFTEWPKTPMKPIREPEASAGGAGGGGQQETLDAYDMVDAVDIFSKKFDEKWSDTVLALPKWSDKKEKLDELVVASSVPKLAPNNYYHIPAMLKRVLNDNNATVACTGIKICGLLAKGIRKPFSGSAKMLFPMLLEKLKDKKTSTLDETKVAMDSFLYCLSIDEVVDDIKEALGQKVPSSKIYTMKWLENFLEKKVDDKKKLAPSFKALVPAIKKLVDDGASDVRDTSLSCLGKIKGIFGESALGNALSDLNPQKLQKLNDAAAKFETKPEPSKGGPSGKNQISPNKMELEMEEEEKVSEMSTRPNSKTSTNAPKAAAKTIQKSATQKTLSQNNSEPNLMKASSSNTPNAKKPAPKGASNTAANNSSNNADCASNKTYEECESLLRGMGLEDTFFSSLESSNWKEKVAAIQNLQSNHSEILESNMEELLKVMKVKTKDWKESNLNTIKEILGLLKTAAAMDTMSFSKKCFWLVVSFLVDKLSDSKYIQSIEEILQSLCRYIPPKFIISQLINNADPKKASPKSTAETCSQISKLIDLVGSSNIPVMELIDFAKGTLACTTPALRTAAITLIKAMYQNVGKELLNFLNDINPQQLKPLLAELDKVVPYSDAQKRSKISFLGEAASDVKEDARGGSNPFDSLPRADISNEANKLLKKLGDAQWKTRKEGLDALESLLTSNNNRISSNNLHDLVGCLKQRLSDPNKSLARGFITYVGKFAEACGKDVKQYSKTLLPALMSNLSDKQGMIRTDVLQSMDKFSAIIGADSIINLSPTYLANESFEMRSELISWLIKNAESFPKVDLKPFVAPVLACLIDKNKEIRIASEQLLEKLAEHCSIAPFSQAVKTQKPAVVQQLKPLFEKFGGFEEEQKRPSTAQPSGQGAGPSQAGDQKKGAPPGTAASSNNNKAVPPSKSQSKLKTLVAGTSGKEDKGFKIFNKEKDSESKESQKNSPSKEGKKQLNTSNIAASATADNFYSNERPATSDPNNFARTSFVGSQAVGNPNTFHRGSIQHPAGYFDFGDQPLALPHICAELKERRVIKELTEMWPMDEICDELAEELISDFKMVCAESLHRKLFSVDFKKHIDAANIFKKLTVSHAESIREISDLLIKWAFLRLWGNNNFELIMEILDLIEQLLGGFAQIGYTPIDFEAKITLGMLRELLLKNDQMKMKVYNIINCLLRIYPGDKVSAFWGDILIKTPQAQLRKEISLLYQNILLKYCHRELIILSKIPEIVNNRDFLTTLCANYEKGYLIQIGGFTESQLNFNSNSYQKIRTAQGINYTQEVESNLDQINAAYSYVNNNPASIPKSQSGTLKPQVGAASKTDEELSKKMASLTTGPQRQQNPAGPQFNNTQTINFENTNAKNLSVLNNVKSLNNASLYGNNTVTSAQGAHSIQSSNALNKMMTQNSKMPSSNKQNSFHDSDSSLNNSFNVVSEGKGFSTISTMISGNNAKPYGLLSNQQASKPNTTIAGLNPRATQGSPKLQEFQRNLLILEEGTVSQKIDALLVINDLISAGNEESKSILQENANFLVNTILAVFNNSFDQRYNVPRQFVQYFLNMIHKMFSVKILFKGITNERLYVLTDSMLNRLIIEDDNKPDNENESFVKPLNSIILRILENSNPNDLFLILWDLLIVNRRKVTFARILGLIIKCILKLTKILDQIIQQINVSQILEKFHLYLVEFSEDQSKPSDDIGIKTIKTVLNELVKLLGDSIWGYYEVIKKSPKQDLHIQKWLSVILKPNQNNALPSPRVSNKTTFASGFGQQNSQPTQIPQQPVQHQSTTPTSQYQQSITPSSQMGQTGTGFRQAQIGGIPDHFGSRTKLNSPPEQVGKLSVLLPQEDPEVREVIESLKKNPNFTPHLKILSDKLALNPGLNLSFYFSDCSKTLADIIYSNLERLREDLGAQQSYEHEKKQQMPFANYEDHHQLNKLKELNKVTSLSNSDYDNFHKKINQIKQRYGKALEPNTEDGCVEPAAHTNNQSYISLKENYSSFGNNTGYVQQQQGLISQQIMPQQQQPMMQYQQQPFTTSLFDDSKSYLQKSSKNLEYLNSNMNRVQTGTGDTFSTSPEYLQQKINDMRTKMQGFVASKQPFSFGEKGKPDE